MQDQPSASTASVWLLIEPADPHGRRLTLGAFSSLEKAEAARRESPHSLWLWCIPVDQPLQRS